MGTYITATIKRKDDYKLREILSFFNLKIEIEKQEPTEEAIVFSGKLIGESKSCNIVVAQEGESFIFDWGGLEGAPCSIQEVLHCSCLSLNAEDNPEIAPIYAGEKIDFPDVGVARSDFQKYIRDRPQFHWEHAKLSGHGGLVFEESEATRYSIKRGRLVLLGPILGQYKLFIKLGAIAGIGMR